MPVTVTQGPVAIQELLTRRSVQLSDLFERAAELARMRQTLERELPPPLREHIMVASYDQKTIVLQTDGPAWAARLRFETPRLLELARAKCNLPMLQTVRVLVAAPVQNRQPRSRSVYLSPRAAEILRNSAQSTNDDAVRGSLLRLSRRG
ncbi:MAG: DUF721 domain-containing protein [Gammaproteobacteria bacterium]|nr:DUF721 domain-containing protein [Gammaproteobacteria bacterium]